MTVIANTKINCIFISPNVNVIISVLSILLCIIALYYEIIIVFFFYFQHKSEQKLGELKINAIFSIT